MPDIYAELAKSDRIFVVAPAGCGKTEAIARATSFCDGRQLILTHTNAGVESLIHRMHELKIPSHKYSIETLDGFCLKFASAYPTNSKLLYFEPKSEQWNAIRLNARLVFDQPFFRRILINSYSGIFVDEYQDCLVEQHEIVKTLSNYMPVRIFGDPLQGIFNFAGQQIVTWNKHVEKEFNKFGELTIPYRWMNTNPELGKWLLLLRDVIYKGGVISLENKIIGWKTRTRENESYILKSMLRETGSIVGIHKWDHEAHKTAKMNKNYYSMEEMDCSSLRDFCLKIEKSNNYQLAIDLKNFLSESMTGVGTFVNPILECIKENRILRIRDPEKQTLALKIKEFIDTHNFELMLPISRSICSLGKCRVYRVELLREFARTIEAYKRENFANLHDAAWDIRSVTRKIGRKPEKRTISRTLLIKGLEFDHAIILNADKLQPKEHFYVAATRGRRSLTILSNEPIADFSK